MSKQDDEILLRQYEAELAQAQQQGNYNPNAYQSTMFGNPNKQNLIEYELDFKPELEDIERLLRCDILVRDKDGNEYWKPNPDKERVFFNELGVNDILRNIIILVNKNKALSNYNAEEINDRVRQIKHELRVLIYNNYEVYGMDNDYKMNNYSMIVLSVGSVVEDVYRRAMGGSTHQGLAEQRIVTQNEPLLPQGMYGMPQMQSQKKSWLNPMSWGK
jgi:hypothetical protein